MTNEINHSLPHELRLENRAKLSITGVQDVESFDENTVVLRTSQGMLIIRGENLHLHTLSIDGGQVSVSGTVFSLTYEELQKAGSFLHRLFG